jgi:hypothetical protein
VKRRTIAFSLAGAAALTAAAFVPTAQATGTSAQTATAACSMNPGSVTAAGAQNGFRITAGTPPTMTTPGGDEGVFPAGQVRLSSTFESEPNVGGSDSSGYVVEGDSLYFRAYNFSMGMDTTQRVGGGWSTFTALEVAHFDEATGRHEMAYGLRGDGTLLRWNLSSGGWRSAGSATGFSAVKSMALIAKTPTYDTFLANTHGGALYTIKLPVTPTMKPVVTPVRTSTWQGFETLVATQCGNYGTLLLGIDKDAKTGYLYAVGHANGTATVINALGKVDGSFPDPVYFRWAPVYWQDSLNGA